MSGLGRKVLVACTDALPPGTSKKFSLDAGGREVECFIVNWQGGYHAYVNRCRHIAMSLDWLENRFFDLEREFLQCPTHGALYRPDTGFCVFGPPAGRSLIRVPLEIRGDEIYAGMPADFEDVP